jgi:hypothetical protein
MSPTARVVVILAAIALGGCSSSAGSVRADGWPRSQSPPCTDALLGLYGQGVARGERWLVVHYLNTLVRREQLDVGDWLRSDVPERRTLALECLDGRSALRYVTDLEQLLSHGDKTSNARLAADLLRSVIGAGTPTLEVDDAAPAVGGAHGHSAFLEWYRTATAAKGVGERYADHLRVLANSCVEAIKQGNDADAMLYFEYMDAYGSLATEAMLRTWLEAASHRKVEAEGPIRFMYSSLEAHIGPGRGQDAPDGLQALIDDGRAVLRRLEGGEAPRAVRHGRILAHFNDAPRADLVDLVARGDLREAHFAALALAGESHQTCLPWPGDLDHSQPETRNAVSWLVAQCRLIEIERYAPR